VVDHLYRVERPDLAEVRTRYLERRVSSGGMVGTALAQAARLGCRTQVLSMVGDDPEGRFIRRSLRETGVRTERLVVSPDFPTTVAVVLVARRGGERRFLVPDRRALERGAPDFDLSPIDGDTVLLVDGHFQAQALRAVRRAREVGASVIADLSRPRRPLLALLPFVDYPIVPLEFAERWMGDDPRQTLRALRDRFGGTPVVTMGRRGGLALIDGRVRRYRAPRVEVRDTTGAGDVFHGAFAAGLVHGLESEAALDLAARAAALNCTALGGGGRLMTLDEMEVTRRSRADAGAPGGRD
jgi:sulfofructose kinase